MCRYYIKGATDINLYCKKCGCNLALTSYMTLERVILCYKSYSTI